MSALYHDRNWPRASEWLTGNSQSGQLAVLGIPLTVGSITPSRCDLAPDAIRAALQRYSPYDAERLTVRDHGNLDVAGLDVQAACAPAAAAIAALKDHTAVILLGGDNSITRPGVHGMGIPLSRCGLLTFDAHFDLRDLDRGLTNGNPVRALLEDGLPGTNIVQIGIQSFANSAAYAKIARDAGITCITVDEICDRGLDAVVAASLKQLSSKCDSLYVDLDLDVLDRAHAPATAGSRPGGLLPREIRRAARQCGLDPKVKIMDLVEIDPTRDSNDVTVLAAGACLLAFASGVVGR